MSPIDEIADGLADIDMPKDMLQRVMGVISVVLQKKRGAKGTKLPENWEPKYSTVQKLIAKGYTERDISQAVERMKDWATANANRAISRKADWDAALCLTWMGQGNRRGPIQRGSQGAPRLNGYFGLLESMNGERSGDTRPTGGSSQSSHPSLFSDHRTLR